MGSLTSATRLDVMSLAHSLSLETKAEDPRENGSTQAVQRHQHAQGRSTACRGKQSWDREVSTRTKLTLTMLRPAHAPTVCIAIQTRAPKGPVLKLLSRLHHRTRAFWEFGKTLNTRRSYHTPWIDSSQGCP